MEGADLRTGSEAALVKGKAKVVSVGAGMIAVVAMMGTIARQSTSSSDCFSSALSGLAEGQKQPPFMRVPDI